MKYGKLFKSKSKEKWSNSRSGIVENLRFSVPRGVGSIFVFSLEYAATWLKIHGKDDFG
jgi:hypothetical protein